MIKFFLGVVVGLYIAEFYEYSFTNLLHTFDNFFDNVDN